MDEETRNKIIAWAREAARRNERISSDERFPLNAFGRDRYAFERGLREHALQPGWGIGVVMNDVVKDLGADLDVVLEMVRTEVEDGDDAAEAILEASDGD